MERGLLTWHLILVLLVVALFTVSCKQEKNESSANDTCYVAAYVWPSCHYEERNAEIL